MNVATLELCKELWELSGWESEKTWVESSQGESSPLVVDSDSTYLGHDIYRVAYAYDLGYLLRKLPTRIEPGEDPGCLAIHSLADGGWVAQYDKRLTAPLHTVDADTPENAVCKMAIELFKQGVLERGQP